MTGIKALIAAVRAWLSGRVRALRARRPVADHLFLAAGRYSREQGGRLTSVITLPGFLSFFPLLGLALSIAGYVSHYDHDAQRQITKAVSGYFPGLNLDDLVTSITEHRTSTGVISVIGLVFSGLGLITTLRGALRSLLRLPQSAGNFFVTRVRDLGTLAALGLSLLVSFALTGAATSATTVIAHHVTFLQGTTVRVLVQIAAYAIAVAADTLLFAVAFTLLPQTGARLRDVANGALFGGIGFVILQSVGSLYLQRTTSNPLYGSFAVAIGLLVWTKLVAQLFVFAAAWAVTAPYQPDTGPSSEVAGGVPVALPPADALTMRQRRAAAGAGTAVFGAVVGLTVVIAVRAGRSVLPRR